MSQLERAADLLNPIDGEHWKQLLQGSWMAMDAEHRHNGLFVSGKIIEAGCNAHGRRKFEAAEKSQPI